MLYTSGTTGRPKGAVLSRAAFEASARASEKNLGWRDDDRWVLCLPVCHVGGLSVITRCLMARRAVVLLTRFDAGAVLDAVVAHRGTILSVVPTMLRALLDADRDGALSRLRVLLSGGALTPRSLLERCARARVRVLTTYGLTEACSQVTTQRPREGEDAFVVHDDAGVALDGTRVEVVDDLGEVVPAGVVGRIRVKGPQLMNGYWRHAPLGDAWLDTGDLGSLDAQGNLRLSARRTDLIVTGGENVYPAEVEQVIDALAGVRASLVFGLADETWGQLVAAAIVREEGAAGDEDAWLSALHDELTRRLASHKRPRRVCVVEELPLRSNGKVDRAGAVARFTSRVREWPGVKFG
jgi:O-succinylbenzoic acid--CoA ligase